MDTASESVHGEVSRAAASIETTEWWPASGWPKCCRNSEEASAATPADREPEEYWDAPEGPWDADRDADGRVPPEAVHVVRARRLLKFLAAGRQDARRVGEDLAIGILLSHRHRKLHRAARLVLKGGSASCTRALALAQRVLAVSPK